MILVEAGRPSVGLGHAYSRDQAYASISLFPGSGARESPQGAPSPLFIGTLRDASRAPVGWTCALWSLLEAIVPPPGLSDPHLGFSSTGGWPLLVPLLQAF